MSGTNIEIPQNQETKYYAQLNNNIVIGVSTLSGEVDSPDMIELKSQNASILGFTYADGLFTGQNKTRTDNQYKIETLVFNPETEVQEVTETVYEPVPKEILLEELKQEYLPQIKDADLLGDTAEKERLQQEYLQKKAEIENE